MMLKSHGEVFGIAKSLGKKVFPFWTAALGGFQVLTLDNRTQTMFCDE